MTTRQVIFIGLIILSLTSCRRGYKIEGDKVYYEYWNEGSGHNKRLLENVDSKTFQALNLDCDCDFKFGKDKDHLFINGEIVNTIDPNTFKFIGNYIFRDKDSAYFFGFYNNLNDCVIKGINPDKIELIKYPWAKADNILIYGKDTVYLADINDFVPIDRDWGKTKRQIINNNRIVYGADIETFKITSNFQGKDRKYNYEFGSIKRDDFKKTNYKTFDFTEKNVCQNGLFEFIDIYDKEVTLPESQNEIILVAEKLKTEGFTATNIRQSDWAVGPRIVSVTLSNDRCNCFVDKVYYYDYSKPSEIEKEYKVTERIHCEPK